MNKEFKILVQSKEKGSIIEIKGTKAGLMYALAELASTLLKDSNLSKEEIKYAIDLGLKPEKEIEEDLKQKKEELEVKMKEFFKTIFD